MAPREFRLGSFVFFEEKFVMNPLKCLVSICMCFLQLLISRELGGENDVNAKYTSPPILLLIFTEQRNFALYYLLFIF